MLRLQKSDFNDVKCLNSGFKKLFAHVCVAVLSLRLKLSRTDGDIIRQRPFRQSWLYLIAACWTELKLSNLEERRDVGLFT